MGKFKDEGDPAITLIEEMSEAIKVISKKVRFQGDWDEVPEGSGDTRWEELCYEMKDVLYQWNRLVMEYHRSNGDNPPLSEEIWGLLANMNKDIQ